MTGRGPRHPPVIVLSSGRCGSTMLSDMLNLHPDILSISEFFTFHSMALFSRWRMTGNGMWNVLTRQPQLVRYLLKQDYEELLYPFDDPGSRFGRDNVPPVLCVTLPHLTNRYEGLFDELEPVVRNFPSQSPANHCRSLFGWLCERFDRKVWVERSGGSSMYASRLINRFPEAKVINMHRDGRDVALSMFHHHPFRGIAPYIIALQKRRYDPFRVEAKHSEFRDSMALRLQPLKYLSRFPIPMPADRLEIAHFGAIWSSMVGAAQDFIQNLPPEQVLDVRFDDLQKNAERELRRIIRFVSSDPENEDWVREAAGIPRPSRSKFAGLDPEERAALTEACRPGLERLGYAV